MNVKDMGDPLIEVIYGIFLHQNEIESRKSRGMDRPGSV